MPSLGCRIKGGFIYLLASCWERLPLVRAWGCGVLFERGYAAEVSLTRQWIAGCFALLASLIFGTKEGTLLHHRPTERPPHSLKS